MAVAGLADRTFTARLACAFRDTDVRRRRHGVRRDETAVHYAIAVGDEGRAAAERALQAEVAAREAGQALRSQVNPHFLFNCLHSISALILNQPEAARRMCLELGDFFRDSLRAGSPCRAFQWKLATLVRRYLTIERARFPAIGCVPKFP